MRAVFVAVTILASVTSYAQAPNPSFEVASVKPSKSEDGRGTIGVRPGGRFAATGATLKMLIGDAYRAGQRLADSQIVDGPEWIDRERFDIVAEAGDDVPLVPNGPIPLMLRTLLQDRFKLAVHTETRELPIYALVMARSIGGRGTQLNPAAVDCTAMRGGPPRAPVAPRRPASCGIRIAPGNLSGGGSTMAQLANTLSRLPDLNRIVRDQTGLTGTFDFDLTWKPDQTPKQLQLWPPLPPIDPDGPSIFAALEEQLGLKLESDRGPVDVLVIDHVERPTAD